MAPVLLTVLLVSGCLSKPATTTPTNSPAIALSAADPHGIELTTDQGVITILLYPEAAPKTVALMTTLVKEGYYDGRAFGRIVPGHVIQITDSTPNGATEDPRRVPLETNATYHFSAGAVGTARDTDPNSGGPELFIMDFATSHLDGNFTVWGQVIAGLDVVHAIARGPGLDAPKLPAAPAPAPAVPNPFPFDRMALPAVTIQSARLVTPQIPPHQAPDFPFQVAKNVRVGELRHSLEWHHGLSAGHGSDFTWYIRPYNQDPVPDAASLTVRIGGETVMVQGDATPGIYHFEWTPPAGGTTYDASLQRSGTTLATLQLLVPA